MMLLPGEPVLAASKTKAKNGWVNEIYYIKGKKAEGEQRIKENGKWLTDHYGNCYVMAGTFCALARQLGYETYQVTGYVPSASGGITPHSWCGIKVNGVWYICDPDFERETGRNGFLIKYGSGGTWRKINYSRMGN